MRFWRPSSRVAQHIANNLLKAYRLGVLPDEWPPSAETNCVFAITHSRLTPGTRAQMGKLWRQFGSEVFLSDREASTIRAELIEALKMSA